MWSNVLDHVGPYHERIACEAYREGLASLGFDRRTIPQLAGMNRKLAATTQSDHRRSEPPLRAGRREVESRGAGAALTGLLGVPGRRLAAPLRPGVRSACNGPRILCVLPIWTVLFCPSMSALATNQARSGAAGRRPATRRAGLPDVDERLVMPETRFEVLDGKVELVPPSDESHGSRHSKISALLEAYAASGYDVASDMLTRTSVKNDLAPDASVFPSARDPRTGGRQIEELAFEVLSTERLGHAAKKARALTERGVRRVFAVDVERKRALVWSTTTNTWQMLPLDSAIEDHALALPLPLRALVEAVSSDDAVAQALLAKKNPVIATALASAERKGKAEGRREGERRGAIKGAIKTLLAVLAARGLTVRKKHEKQIREADDEAVLAAWIVQAVTCASVDELLTK